MARINVEDCWWTDPRRSALSRLLGSEETADGVVLRAWRLAQEFWRRNRSRVPKAIFDVLRGSQELVQVGLAEIQDDFVYIRGTASHLEWVAERQAQSRLAGQKSAKARQIRYGSSQPMSNEPRTTPNEPRTTPNEPRTKINQTEPSYSYSSSNEEEEKKLRVCTDVERERSPVGAVPDLAGDAIVKESLDAIPHKTQTVWVRLYGAEFVTHEIRKATAWLEVNPRRRPKTYARFYGAWLARGWERHRKQIPTTTGHINVKPIKLEGIP